MALTQVTPSMLANSGAELGMRNRIINGAMQISQRTAVNTNVAVGTGTSGTFGPDRFSAYTGTGSLWNISQVSTSAYDFPYALRLQRIAAQTSTSAVYLRQIIETANCIDLAGQSVILSFYATAGATYSGGAATVSVFTGTAADQGTAALNTATWTGLVSPINSTFTPTTTRTRYTFTGTIGATVQEIAFSISWSGSGTAGATDYIDITGVQLEVGTVATPFERRLYGQELALCQRYYEKSYDAATAPGSASSNGYSSINNTNTSTSLYVFNTDRFVVLKRAAPTVRFWDLAGNLSRMTNYTLGGLARTDNLNTVYSYTGYQSSAVMINTPTASVASVYQWDASAEL